jgi:hypothetical protein
MWPTKSSRRHRPWPATAALLCACCLAAIIVAPSATMAKRPMAHTHYVDRGPTNWLFRGGWAVNSTGFAYDKLLHTMKQKALEEAGEALPANPFVMIISLSNELDGKDFARREAEFWTAHPELGNLTQWMIGFRAEEYNTRLKQESELAAAKAKGRHHLSDDDEPQRRRLNEAMRLGASHFPEAQRAWLASEDNPEGVWAVDHVPTKVRYVRQVLMTPSPERPIIIYIHCTKGCDRTGQILGGYLLDYVVHNISVVYHMNAVACGEEQNGHSTFVSGWAGRTHQCACICRHAWGTVRGGRACSTRTAVVQGVAARLPAHCWCPNRFDTPRRAHLHWVHLMTCEPTQSLEYYCYNFKSRTGIDCGNCTDFAFCPRGRGTCHELHNITL